jgi:hypothetical protein
MKVGILGSGDVATSLGSGFVTLGHEVRLGSRSAGNPKVVAWAKGTKGKGSYGTFSDAAAFGEVVVLATHGVATEEAIRIAGPTHFDGKVVIDPTNPIAFSAQGLPRLAIGLTTSQGEVNQRSLPRAHVVKAFNIIGHEHMFRPNFPGGPPDMFICGNDEAAKKKVEQILHDFGWSSVLDLGGIEASRELESLCVLWVTAGTRLQNFRIAFRLLRK